MITFKSLFRSARPAAKPYSKVALEQKSSVNPLMLKGLALG